MEQLAVYTPTADMAKGKSGKASADDVILYGASLSKDKANAMQYLNKILSNWNGQGVKTLKQAQGSKVEIGETKASYIRNNYTKEQINSLIANLDEVEV